MGIEPGDTFILKRGTGSTPHLWVVLWGPAGAADAYLIVHLTTLRPHTDQTVVMPAGEHPFIPWAVYSDARRTTAEKLNAAWDAERRNAAAASRRRSRVSIGPSSLRAWRARAVWRTQFGRAAAEFQPLPRTTGDATTAGALRHEAPPPCHQRTSRTTARSRAAPPRPRAGGGGIGCCPAAQRCWTRPSPPPPRARWCRTASRSP